MTNLLRSHFDRHNFVYMVFNEGVEEKKLIPIHIQLDVGVEIAT